MRGSPSPGSDRDRSAKSGAAARAAVSPLFCGHRRDCPITGRCPAPACRDKCPQLKDRIADLFCSAKVNCGRSRLLRTFWYGWPTCQPRKAVGRPAMRQIASLGAPTKSHGARPQTDHAPRPAASAHASRAWLLCYQSCIRLTSELLRVRQFFAQRRAPFALTWRNQPLGTACQQMVVRKLPFA